MQEMWIINLNQHSCNDYLLYTLHCGNSFEGTEKKNMKVAFDIAYSLIEERKTKSIKHSRNNYINT